MQPGTSGRLGRPGAALLAAAVLVAAVGGFAVLVERAADIGSPPADAPASSSTAVPGPSSTTVATTATAAALAAPVGRGVPVVVLADSNGTPSRRPFLDETGGEWATSYNAVAGAHMGNLGLGWARAAAAMQPAVVVIALVTNDALLLAPATDPLPLWEQAIEALEGSCVVVLLPYTGAVAGDSRREWAPRIAGLAAQLGARIVDFGATVVPGDVDVDDLHLTQPQGQRRYTDALETAVRTCL